MLTESFGLDSGTTATLGISQNAGLCILWNVKISHRAAVRNEHTKRGYTYQLVHTICYHIYSIQQYLVQQQYRDERNTLLIMSSELADVRYLFCFNMKGYRSKLVRMI